MDPSPPPPYKKCVLPESQVPPMDPEIHSALERHFAKLPKSKQKSFHKMIIHSTTPMPAFSYTLQAFTEERHVKMLCQPYRNQFIDRNQEGRLENKWSIPLTPPASFVFFAKSDMPHSSNILSCPNCCGKGVKSALGVKGCITKLKRCPTYMGSGMQTSGVYEIKCQRCLTSGRIEETCQLCLGGRIQCPKCEGHKSLHYWESMEVKWKTSTSKASTNREELGETHFAKALDREIAQKMTPGDRNEPLQCSEDGEITRAAERLVLQMLARQNQDLKVLEYRQKIYKIPVEKVSYTWKEEEGYFFIYGTQRCIYFPKRFQNRKMKCVIA